LLNETERGGLLLYKPYERENKIIRVYKINFILFCETMDDMMHMP
jgi:hypothetical protein